MAAEDYLDAFDDREDCNDDIVFCKFCGDECYWEEARGERNEKRWVLMTACGDAIHTCPAFPVTRVASLDEFPTE